MLPQLRDSGTLTALQLMTRGMPNRLPYEKMHARYAAQMPSELAKLPPRKARERERETPPVPN